MAPDMQQTTSVRARRARIRAAGTRAAGAAAMAAVAIVASGCAVKGADNANLIIGKQQFVSKCGSCHTLARANTKGIVGPNLDQAFRASVDEGLGRASVRGVVEWQVKIPNPQGAMPKDLAKGAQLRDIAAYVAASVARTGSDTGLLATAVEAPGSGKPAVAKGGKLEIPASPTGQLAYVSSSAQATSGALTITMPNQSGVSHNIAVEAGKGGASGSGSVIGASSYVSKGSVAVTVTLKPGTYTYFCQAPGHRAAGMFGTLTVK